MLAARRAANEYGVFPDNRLGRSLAARPDPFPEQAVRASLRDPHRHDLADRHDGRSETALAADRATCQPSGPDDDPASPRERRAFGPTVPWLKACRCISSRSCSRASRSAFTASGTWASISAAGVPGRGLYLNEKALAKPTSATSRMRLLEIRIGLAGEADDEIGGQRRFGPAARMRSIRRRYSSPVCLRFMASRMRSEPDCTGRCR